MNSNYQVLIGDCIVEFDKLLEAVYDAGYDDAAHECDYDAMGSKALSNARLYFQQALNKLHAQMEGKL